MCVRTQQRAAALLFALGRAPRPRPGLSAKPPSPPRDALRGRLRFGGCLVPGTGSEGVLGDSRSCEVVMTSLSTEQTSPEALGAFGLSFIPDPLRLTLKAGVFFFQLGMLFGQLCDPLLRLRALLFQGPGPPLRLK